MKRVMVGLSGGVDSAVAAARLKAEGYSVIGAFIKVWHPDFLVCNWEQERRDAMRVAAQLDIPFLTCDAETTYYEDVAKYFIEAYRSGLTPNPDVMCNRAVKFGVFWSFAQDHGADYIATGHYAQNIFNFDTQEYELHRGIDADKDQTYFLWTLTQSDLQHALFPIGNTTKSDIRTEASDLHLASARKQDSQGICFLGQVDIPEFLSHFITLEQGSVCDTHGSIIGTHLGSICYTLGQRHGFHITDHKFAGTPLYVIATEHSSNKVIVDEHPPQLPACSDLTLHSTVLNAACKPGSTCEVQTRYRQKPLTATITEIHLDRCTIKTTEVIDGFAAGQSCVLYQGTQCLGGGIIQ